MIVLDSNIISAMMRLRDDQLVDWLDAQPLESLWTTSVCVYEIEFGLRVLPAGKRRTLLQIAFNQALRTDLGGRVLDFDGAAASQAASIAAQLRSVGRPVEVRDAMIAGIVAAHGATLATRNTKHFADSRIRLVNPWEERA